MLILGTKGREKVGGTGPFYCPNCRQTRTYVHKILKRFFTLYFIPLIPMGTLGEWVECTVCGEKYKTDILSPQKFVSK